MTVSLVGLLVGLVIICLVFWAARAICSAFGIGEPITTIVNVVLVIFVIFWLLSLLGAGPSIHIG